MKEFELPERWKVRDCEEVSLYAKKKWKTDIYLGTYFGFYCEGPETYYFLDSVKDKKICSQYTEITLEEFKEHVLNECKLPERWYLEPTENPYEMEAIYDWMQTQNGGNHWEIMYAKGYHLHNFIKPEEERPAGMRSVDPKYTKISFTQFEKYVLKIQNKTKDSKYLIKLLKELNLT